jgi:hypothetical protein
MKGPTFGDRAGLFWLCFAFSFLTVYRVAHDEFVKSKESPVHPLKVPNPEFRTGDFVTTIAGL